MHPGGTGKAFKKDGPVAPGDDPGVQDQDDSPVRVPPHEPAEPLAEAHHRVRQGKLSEGVAALLLDGGHARFEDGLSGDPEGKPAQDHHLQGFPGRIHSLPE